jgi:hypothetical protein
MQEHRDLGPAMYVRFLLAQVGGLVLARSKRDFASPSPIQVAHVTASDLPGGSPGGGSSRFQPESSPLRHLPSSVCASTFYSNEERKARHDLGEMRKNYGLAE